MSHEECDCSCHRDKNIYHLVACCETCPMCERRVRNLKRHMTKKHPEKDTEESEGEDP